MREKPTNQYKEEQSSKSELEIASLVSSVDRAILTAVLRNRSRVRVPHGALLFSYSDSTAGPVLDSGNNFFLALFILFL